MVVRNHRLSGIAAIGLVGMLAAQPRPALADRAAPTPAQLERAKQAFADGRKLHDAGKLAEAIEKFKLSYELSGNPLLLYNIALTMQELGSDDLAVVYYRRFLAEDAADAAQRQDASDRIAAITRKLAPPSGDATAGGAPAGDATAQDAVPADASQAPSASSGGLVHIPVESAPPGQPLDLTATVRDGAGVAVTLFFRTAGQASFISTPMVPHGGELVGRIPASRMTGSALQYYLVGRDPSGVLVARSGKSTVPNVVAIDAGAAARFYPDVAEPVLTPVAAGDHDAEDPLARAAAPPALGQGDGLLDVGSRRFAVAKWSTTALAGVSVGVGITLYVLARDHARALEDDATGCGTPPCRPFDGFDRDIERTGKLEQTISNVALFSGIAIAAAAGYLWIRELTAPNGEPSSRAAARGRRAPHAAPRWLVAPSIGSAVPSHGTAGGFTGATAAVRF
jgi:hypothetical protein